jgi:UDP-N-acetylmuramoyl-tripeptide--D-alanyl-D-alanine ligase
LNLIDIYRLFLEGDGRFTTDSRHIEPGSMFFALKGDKFNGNAFAAKALADGARWAIIDEVAYQQDERMLLVDDVLTTLQDLARQHRKSVKGLKVIGITGSNGKTTTKELLREVLSTHYRTWATPGNLNNHIGVPITLLRMPLDTEYAVIEMGANHPGEVLPLCEIAQPDYALVTSVGKEHLEGFGSLENIIATECENYAYVAAHKGTLFLHQDDAELMAYAGQFGPAIYYGSGKEADCVGRLLGAEWFVRLQWENSYRLMLRAPVVETQLFGSYNYVNLLAAACVARYCSVPYDKINAALAAYKPANNRSQLLESGGNRVILDAYNANPHSMTAAVENFIALESAEKVLVLGDMFELGDAADEEHLAVLDLIAKGKFDEVLLCGPLFGKFASEYPAFQFYDSLEQLIEKLPFSSFHGKTLLIKGSRGMQMERYLRDL